MRHEPWYAMRMLTILLSLLACSPDSSAPEAKEAPDLSEEVADCPAGLIVERPGHSSVSFAFAESGGIDSAVWIQPLADSWVFQCPDQDSTLHILWGD